MTHPLLSQVAYLAEYPAPRRKRVIITPYLRHSHACGDAMWQWNV